MTGVASWAARRPWLVYALPFLTFILLTAAQGAFPPAAVSWTYPAKTVLVAVVVLALWRAIEIPGKLHPGTGTAVGIAVLVIWILPEGLYPLMGDPGEPFDPWSELGTTQAVAWIAIRIVGTAVLVPIVEELFWRGFLIRWIIDQDFLKVPLGKFTWPSFLITSVLFAVEHNRWLVGLAAGIVYNLLLYRTKSLKACVLAHGVTNLGLAAYVLVTGEWGFW